MRGYLPIYLLRCTFSRRRRRCRRCLGGWRCFFCRSGRSWSLRARAVFLSNRVDHSGQIRAGLVEEPDQLRCGRVQDPEQLRENDFARGQLRERLDFLDRERLAVENRGSELQLVAERSERRERLRQRDWILVAKDQANLPAELRVERFVGGALDCAADQRIFRHPHLATDRAEPSTHLSGFCRRHPAVFRNQRDTGAAETRSEFFDDRALLCFLHLIIPTPPSRTKNPMQPPRATWPLRPLCRPGRRGPS